jgi:hypothetical protein
MESIAASTEFEPALKQGTVANIRRKNYIKEAITNHKTHEEVYDHKKTIQ